MLILSMSIWYSWKLFAFTVNSLLNVLFKRT
jgi:hypothetical protein